MSLAIKSNRDFIWEEEGDYTLSRKQARQIFINNATIFQCECWKRRRQEDATGCDDAIKDVVRNVDGTVTIGCTTIEKSEIAKVLKWLKGKKSTKKGKR